MTDVLGHVQRWMGVDSLTRFFPDTLSFAYYSFERLTTVFQVLRCLAVLSLLHAICRVFPWGRVEFAKCLIDSVIWVYIGIALSLLAVISCDVFLRMSLGAGGLGEAATRWFQMEILKWILEILFWWGLILCVYGIGRALAVCRRNGR